MIFEKINITHLPILEAWAKEKATQQFLSGMFPLKKFFNYLLTADHRLSYFIFFQEKNIGMVDIEFYPDENTAAMSLLIAPSERGKGWGTRILKEVILLPNFNNYGRLDAFIDPKNTASIRCFEKAGFLKTFNNLNKDGLFQLSYVWATSTSDFPS